MVLKESNKHAPFLFLKFIMQKQMLRCSIPPTGIPMPFISAGGTSLSVFMSAIGILCNIGEMALYY